MSDGNSILAELDAELTEPCYFCGSPRVDGNCIAYHWHDAIHLRNAARLKEGLPPEDNPPELAPKAPKTEVSEVTNWGPCWVCGAPTDPEGRCTRVNEFYHTPLLDAAARFFHSKAEFENAPPVTFLIDGFLQCEGVTAIAAPVRERKTLIALNMAHALVTGEKLFDYFPVVKRPDYVIYLCPEVSLGPFKDRVYKIGLGEYIGSRFFVRTMSAPGALDLSDPDFRGILPGSVVFLDTAIRFLKGDENSSQDVRAFADTIFGLLKAGALAVVLLHHSPKDSGDGMTLENAMRGSGDMGAFLACCWGTKLQDPADPYKSASYLENLKMRDFESRPFEVTCGPDCRMHIIGDPGTRFVSLSSRKGNRPNKDGADGAAEQVIRANMETPIRRLQELLTEQGIRRGTTWIAKARAAMRTDSAEAAGPGKAKA